MQRCGVACMNSVCLAILKMYESLRHASTSEPLNTPTHCRNEDIDLASRADCSSIQVPLEPQSHQTARHLPFLGIEPGAEDVVVRDRFLLAILWRTSPSTPVVCCIGIIMPCRSRTDIHSADHATTHEFPDRTNVPLALPSENKHGRKVFEELFAGGNSWSSRGEPYRVGDCFEEEGWQ